MDDGQHADTAAGVILAIEPGDRKEMRELPEENDGEHDERAPLEVPAGSGPSEDAGHGAGKGADKRTDWVYPLERRVGGEIDEGGEERKPSGERVAGQAKVEGAA